MCEETLHRGAADDEDARVQMRKALGDEVCRRHTIVADDQHTYALACAPETFKCRLEMQRQVEKFLLQDLIVIHLC